MDLKAWREKRKGEKFTLPSGLDVQVQRVDLLDLAVKGGIPAPLVGSADAMIGGMKVNVAQFTENEAVINLIVMACMIQPCVVEEKTDDDDQVCVHELSMQDRLAIYNWANSGVARLMPFREKPSEPDRSA